MADNDDRQCRICLSGDDPALGKLFKPCKCDGSIRYVHIQCLNSWRSASTSRSAFFECPQCHYSYRFARTRIVGIATSPFVLSALSLSLFILLVFLASFVASFILNHFEDSENPYSYWYYDPISATRDLIASAVHLVDHATTTSSSAAFPRNINWSRSPSLNMPSTTTPGIIVRLIHRFLLGLSVIGITSFAQWLWTMSLMGPFRILRFRGLRDRRERGGGSVLSILIIVFVIAGAARALLSTYRFVERKTQQLLVRAEYHILEVNS